MQGTCSSAELIPGSENGSLYSNSLEIEKKKKNHALAVWLKHRLQSSYKQCKPKIDSDCYCLVILAHVRAIDYMHFP